MQSYSLEQIQARGWEVSKSAPSFQAHKDWDYDTRNLSNTQDNLQAIISKKLQKLANNKTATECLQDLSKQIQENATRYRELSAFYKKATADSQFDTHKLKLTPTTQKLREELGTNAKEVLLSGWTIRTHTHHDNISVFDYSLLNYVLENDYKIKHSKQRHIVYFSKLGSHYRAVFKVTNDKQEVYLLSLVKSNKELQK